MTSVLDVAEWSQLHGLICVIHGESVFSTLWIGGCMGPRASLDALEREKSLAAAQNWAIFGHFSNPLPRNYTKPNKQIIKVQDVQI